MEFAPQAPPAARTTRERCVFLDGLRGWGALAVVLWHCFIEVFPYSPESARFLTLLAPFNGVLAVNLFFVISGFSLSIGYVRGGDRFALARMAASRYPRLALPILGACGLVYLAMVSGLILPPALRPAPLNTALLFEPSLLHVIQFSLFDVFFRFSYDRAYILPLWTMPIELAGSALVFGLLAVFGRWSWRVWMYGMLFAGLLLFNSVYGLFVGGLILAEFHARDCFRGRLARYVLPALFVVGALLPWLVRFIPLGIYFVSVVGMCAAVAWSAPLRWFFETGTSRFLGRVSFQLYLVHGPLLYSFSLWLKSALLSYGLDLGTTHLIISLLTVPAAIGVAILFTPINDAGIAVSRRFGAWIVERVSGAPRRGMPNPSWPGSSGPPEPEACRDRWPGRAGP